MMFAGAKVPRLGTWVPLRDGRTLAERNGVLDKLRPIFDYVPGDVSPPQAPKHTTNSNKPRIPKAPTVKKIPSRQTLLSTPHSMLMNRTESAPGLQPDKRGLRQHQ